MSSSSLPGDAVTEASDMSSTPLAKLFLQAQRGMLDLETTTLETRDPLLQRLVASLLEKFQQVEKMVESLALYSKNEDVDDLATSSIRYLLTPFYMAQLHLQVLDDQRPLHLLQAKQLFTGFLATADAYELLDKADARVLNSDAVGLDPEAKRAAKIERFRRAKQEKQAFQLLQLRMEQQAARQGTAAGDGDGDDDSELSRELALLRVQSCGRHALQELDMIEQELDMLRSMGRLVEEHGKDEVQVRMQKERAQAAAAPKKPPVTITMKDIEKAKRDVFKPGFSQPTMTLDEYVDQLEASGTMASLQTPGGAASEEPPSPTDSDNEVDAETMKKRAWDEYVDGNPKGRGVTSRF